MFCPAPWGHRILSSFFPNKPQHLLCRKSQVQSQGPPFKRFQGTNMEERIFLFKTMLRYSAGNTELHGCFLLCKRWLPMFMDYALHPFAWQRFCSQRPVLHVRCKDHWWSLTLWSSATVTIFLGLRSHKELVPTGSPEHQGLVWKRGQERKVTALFCCSYPMEFHVQATGIADWLAFSIPAPQCGCTGVAVGTRKPNPTGSWL